MQISYLFIADFERLIKSHSQKILNKSNINYTMCNCAGGCKYDLKEDDCRSENIIFCFVINNSIINLVSTSYVSYLISTTN